MLVPNPVDKVAAAPSARPRLGRIAVIVNPHAGGVGPGAVEALRRLIARHGWEPSICAPEPGDMESAVRSVVGSSPDLVIVLAGDGTARLTAELCGPDGPLVAPLPGGTLNMLPHALYGPVSWANALTAILEAGVEREICGGVIHGRSFHVAAVLGSPALWSRAREAMRAGHFREAVSRGRYALARAFTGGLRHALDADPPGRAEALVLISPIISRAMEGEEGLEAAVLDIRNAGEVFRLAVNGLIGDWRHDPGVTAATSRRGRVWARRSIPCILDGEVYRMPSEVSFTFRPRAFRALVPASPPS